MVSLPRGEAEPVYVELDDALVLHPELELHPLRSVTSEGVLALINDLLAEASVADATRPAAPNALGPVVLVRSDATPAAIDAMGLLTRLAKDMRVLAVRWLVCGSGWRDAAPRGGWVTSVVLLPPEAAISTPDIFNVDAGSGWDLPTQSPNAPTFSGGPYTRLVWIFTFLSAIAVVIYVLDL